MVEFKFINETEIVLVEIPLGISASEGSLLKNDNKVIKALFGKENKVSIGQPESYNIFNYLNQKGENIPWNIQEKSDRFDFYLVNISCSFLPDLGCYFTWARLGIILSAVINDKITNVSPTVIDMFPTEILQESKFEKTFSLSSSLNLEFFSVKGVLGTDNKKTKTEGIIYQPELISFGIGSSEVAWQFSATNEKGIWGNKSGLTLLVRTLKHSSIHGQFELSVRLNYENK